MLNSMPPFPPTMMAHSIRQFFPFAVSARPWRHGVAGGTPKGPYLRSTRNKYSVT
jgi:hypothetical protein